MVIVLTDDQGWGDVGFNGNKIIQTPTLDSLSEVGVVFDRFYVSPVCAPTRASILTGKYHLATGTSWVTRRKEVMRTEEETMAEILKQNGYSTACFGKWHNGMQYPHNAMGQGFDYFFGFNGGHLNNYFNADLDYNGQQVSTNGFVPDVLTDSVITYIQKQASPFFAFVAYNTPHTPYQVPDKYFDNYKNQGLDAKTATIYGMCENIDDNVSRIQKALKNSNELDNTIFIYLSDNGPNYVRFNGGLKGRKAQVDEGGVRVPFILHYPDGKFAAHKIKTEFAAHIDILPTILDLCHIPAQEHNFHGVSFVPMLNNKNNTMPDRLFFSHQIINNQKVSSAVRSRNLLMTCYPNDTALFNIVEDPCQMKNIYYKRYETTEKLKQQYNQWFTQVTHKGIQPEPVHVGHEHWPKVELPAHEGTVFGNVKYHGGAGWANDWVENFKHEGDSILWNIEVVEPGNYWLDVELLAKKDDIGKLFYVEIADQLRFFEIQQENQIQKVENRDRVKRKEVEELIWGKQAIGNLDLEEGYFQLKLASSKNHENSVIIKGLELRKFN